MDWAIIFNVRYCDPCHNGLAIWRSWGSYFLNDITSPQLPPLGECLSPSIVAERTVISCLLTVHNPRLYTELWLRPCYTVLQTGVKLGSWLQWELIYRLCWPCMIKHYLWAVFTHTSWTGAVLGDDCCIKSVCHRCLLSVQEHRLDCVVAACISEPSFTGSYCIRRAVVT